MGPKVGPKIVAKWVPRCTEQQERKMQRKKSRECVQGCAPVRGWGPLINPIKGTKRDQLMHSLTPLRAPEAQWRISQQRLFIYNVGLHKSDFCRMQFHQKAFWKDVFSNKAIFERMYSSTIHRRWCTIDVRPSMLKL